MKDYIYFVGKPYPQLKAVNHIRQLGFGVGLLRDPNISLKHSEAYDKVVPLDFSRPDKMMAEARKLNISMSGLVCTYENYIVAKAHLAAHFNLPALTPASAEMCTDKFLMRQAFLAADKAITPQCRLVGSQEELLQAAAHMRFPLILKPTNLVKSLLVLRCNNETELISNFSYAQSHIVELYQKYKIYGRQPHLIVEEYILGKTCSVAAFVDKNGEAHFCEGIAALVNAQDRAIDDNYIFARHLPGHFSKALSSRLFDVAAKGIKALGMTSSPAHVELIYNDHEVKLIEIGARMGGYRPRMYEYSYGADLIKQEVSLAVGQPPDISGTFRAYTSVFELFPESEGHFQRVEGADNTSDFAYFSVKPMRGDLVGPAKNGYKASVVVMVTSQNDQEHQSRCKLIDNIRIVVSA